jgi:branched-chain amino acid transport system permease protein
VALSLNVINGMAGQFSIGHAGFIGIGGYTSAVMASHLHVSLGGGEPTFARSFIVVPVCLVASAGMAGLFGFLVGLPSLRLKGDYLAIVTLGFAEIFRLVIATAQAGDANAKGGVLTKIGSALSSLGGQNGYQGIANQGVPLYAGPFWVFGLAFVLGVIAWRIKFSGWGRALRALREDEIAGAAVGVDPTRYKVTSFVIAAVGAGIAGGLMAIMRDGTPTVNPDNYNFAASFDAITMVILGGSGSVSGSAIGGVFITFTIKAIELLQNTSVVQDLRRSFEGLDLNALRMIIYAMVLVALMILRPEGLLGERELFQKRVQPAKGKA